VTCDRSGFSPGTPVSSTNKTDRYDIAEILFNEYTEFQTCTRCNPVVTDYDSLETAAIGMCVDG
jgi:hypothetical protein